MPSSGATKSNDDDDDDDDGGMNVAPLWIWFDFIRFELIFMAVKLAYNIAYTPRCLQLATRCGAMRDVAAPLRRQENCVCYFYWLWLLELARKVLASWLGLHLAVVPLPHSLALYVVGNQMNRLMRHNLRHLPVWQPHFGALHELCAPREQHTAVVHDFVIVFMAQSVC